jgi:hypothetical protein
MKVPLEGLAPGLPEEYLLLTSKIYKKAQKAN